MPPAPGWVSRVLQKRQAIEQILGVPLEAMYGCGHFGCVFESEEPWSVKITRDPTEGDMWATLQAFVSEQDYGTAGIARVKDIVRLTPDIQWRGRWWPLHAIVREEIQPLYENAPGLRLTDYTRKRLGVPEGTPFPGMSFKGLLTPLQQGNLDELRRLERGLGHYKEWAEEWHRAATHKRAGSRDSLQALAEQRMLEATNLMGGPIGGYIGESLTVLLDHKIVLKDVHLGNIGWRVHEQIEGEELQDTLIIFDPGHSPTEAKEIRQGALG